MSGAFVVKLIREFTDSPAGRVKRSPSSIVPDIGITVSFIHQTSDYIEISIPGVKQYIHYHHGSCLIDHSVFCGSHEGLVHVSTCTYIHSACVCIIYTKLNQS